ncbi:DUF2797 domain-containing protein [Streptomyces sp. NPDC006197]|uniref:DUF2797 domain-containing protein n=1 Tax=Streptomyces sp. NPDC006197 TaxID=3156685 RepID=UPI0033B87035
MEWWSRGIDWAGGAPGLRWRGGRVSTLAYGQRLAFRAVGVRRCPGARGNPCPLEAVVPGRSTGGRCPECARLDRAHSVAADTVADDPQPYRVYLAWFGPGMTKVGITAEARGETRLLEQGAVAFSWLGRGPLMAARRTEEVLRHALPPAGERAREVEELYRRARAVGGWTETLEPLEFAARDHAGVFRLDGLPRLDGTVAELVGGGVVTGRLLAAAGPDLHLLAPDGRCLALDTRLMRGWILEAAGEGEGFSVPVVPVAAPVVESAQEGLF